MVLTIVQTVVQEWAVIQMVDTDMLHMSALEKKVEQQEQLLRESLPILRRAFFANYQDQDKCDELRDKIGKVVGEE